MPKGRRQGVDKDERKEEDLEAKGGRRRNRGGRWVKVGDLFGFLRNAGLVLFVLSCSWFLVQTYLFSCFVVRNTGP